MNDPKNYPVEQTELPLIRSIDEAVGEAKMSDEWRHAYMIYQVHQQDAELRGIAIGEERGEKRGIAIGEERGEKRGIAIGEERGEKRNMVKTAMGMLRENLPIEMISRITGLPISEINKLKASPSAT